MKKLWYLIRNLFLSIFVVLGIALTLVCNVVTGPFQIIRYRKSAFYRNLGVKFNFYIPNTYTYTLYNRIHDAGLPIEYLLPEDPEQAADGFFLWKDTLLIHDLSEIVYSDQLQSWTVYPEDQEPLADTVADILLRVKQVRAEEVARIVILMDREDLELGDLARAQDDPLFLLHSGSDLEQVLNHYIQAH